MLVVDTSAWIHFFRGAEHPAADTLAQLLHQGEVRIVVPDLVLFELLRGSRTEADWRQGRRMLGVVGVEATCDPELAVLAADHWRQLRARGLTVRSPVDVLIATFCIENDYALLHCDRDYDAFEEHRGLRVWEH